ncbi:MAG: hypothetical protein AAF557_07790 [Pseudomonadota bacterium]
MRLVRHAIVLFIITSVSACWVHRHETSTLDGKEVQIAFQPERAIVTIPGRIAADQIMAVGPGIIAPHTDCTIDLERHKKHGLKAGFTSSSMQITYFLDCGPNSYPKPALAAF